MLDLILVQCMRVFVLSIGVIEVKLLVDNIFGYAIHLHLRLMDNNLGIRYSACVNFTFLQFRLEKRTFSDTNTNLEFS